MLDVEFTGSAIRNLPRKEIRRFIDRCVRALRRRHALPEDVSNLSVAFVSDGVMRKLNREFRSRNKTTDVLTFAGDPSLSGSLGEIVISLDQAKRQALEEKHSLATEVRYLLLHGLIHACGYDHAADRGEMDQLEMQVRAAVNLY